jgi:hypothetical protein
VKKVNILASADKIGQFFEHGNRKFFPSCANDLFRFGNVGCGMPAKCMSIKHNQIIKRIQKMYYLEIYSQKKNKFQIYYKWNPQTMDLRVVHQLD